MSHTAPTRFGAVVAPSTQDHARPSGRPTDNPLRGIVLLVAAMALFSCSDVTAKYLNKSLPPVEIAWMRYGAYMVFMLPFMVRSGGVALRSADPRLQIFRGIAMLGSAVIFIWATRFLPLADATATAFVSPLFITILSIPLLGERVGIYRWSAIAAGLVGVLIVVRPGGHGFQLAGGLPILSSLCWAFAIILTRRMAGRDSLMTTLIYSAISGFAVMTLLLPSVFVVPNPAQIGLGCLIGIFSTAAQWLVALAYRQADASLLAPFGYSQIIWATSFGFIVFGAIPDHWTLLGAAIIIASGLFTAHRERVLARRRIESFRAGPQVQPSVIE